MGTQTRKGSKLAIVLLSIVVVGLIGFIIIDKSSLLNKESSNTNNSETPKDNVKTEDSNTNETSQSSDITANVNKRLYSVNSDLNQQRYYLLLDDATYDDNQNFLNKKTYILDMNMVNGAQIVKEVDLASVFQPIAEQYINSHKGNNSGNCTVEYFSATKGLTPPQIDYDKEVAFKGYYRCTNNNVETSLGSEIYSYNVETNTIKDLGASN